MSTLASCMAAAPDFLLDDDDAATIIEQQIATIATEWASICARAGLTETDHKLLAGRQFLNPCCIEGLTGHQALQDAFLGARNSLVAGGDEC